MSSADAPVKMHSKAFRLWQSRHSSRKEQTNAKLSDVNGFKQICFIRSRGHVLLACWLLRAL